MIWKQQCTSFCERVGCCTIRFLYADETVDLLESLRLTAGWQPALAASFSSFHRKPAAATMQVALRSFALGQVLSASTIRKVQDCFFPKPVPKSAQLVSQPV